MDINDVSIYYLVFLLSSGQLDELSGRWSGRAELLVDDTYHYYLKVIPIFETKVSVASVFRPVYHFRAQMQVFILQSLFSESFYVDHIICFLFILCASGICGDSESSIREENTLPAGG